MSEELNPTVNSPAMRGVRRRKFLGHLGGAAVVLGTSSTLGAPWVRTHAKTRSRKRIAIVGTVINKYSHMEHFVDRFIEGFGWQGGWHSPQVEVVSLYCDQFPDQDLGRERSLRTGIPLYPTLPEALTQGGSKLAVDGVVIIGEHGRYPRNEKGQVLYPRHRLFKDTVRVFEQSGRSVPVFQDKHLSTDWNECREQVADSRRLGFPYLAGSSLPVTWRIPAVEIPWGTDLEESVAVCYGGVDSYDFHGYETAQCMSERRRGGESGVRSVQMLKGAAVCDWLQQNPRTWELVRAALCRSFSLRPRPGFTFALPELGWLRESPNDYAMNLIEHTDGFRSAMVMFTGMLQDFTYAGRMRNGDVVSCQMHLPMPPRLSTLASFFSPLVHHIEQMILTGQAPYPIERTLLTSGLTLMGVESLHQGSRKLATPFLDVAYQAPRESTFWQA